MAQKIERHS